ncbi:ABC transporter ATP-binding protein [uncultured Psychroserpens sp.]|uniref:ATP-binding cassette domain-containing protein n=1 Tax=uncultured Psychroserpens sp. TaxID=255436 RepID=UPI0026068CA3|nr:ABC transporter ATP-binding protein [uncultured Psychroserpens sp.]
MTLEVDNIELYFSNKRILNGIYLKAETKKITTILGSNGCGKSSLLRIIFGDLMPKYKLIRINKEPIKKPLYRTGRISILPQHNFIPSSVKINYAFNILGVNWSTFIDTFEGFSKYKYNSMNQLSGGERRVVETYLILKSESEIVLLDEPFSHIAPLYIEKIKQLITDVKKDKVIILTDHIYKHVINIADKIYLLNDGHSKLISDLKELEFYNYINIGSLDS